MSSYYCKTAEELDQAACRSALHSGEPRSQEQGCQSVLHGMDQVGSWTEQRDGAVVTKEAVGGVRVVHEAREGHVDKDGEGCSEDGGC